MGILLWRWLYEAELCNERGDARVGCFYSELQKWLSPPLSAENKRQLDSSPTVQNDAVVAVGKAWIPAFAGMTGF